MQDWEIDGVACTAFDVWYDFGERAGETNDGVILQQQITKSHLIGRDLCINCLILKKTYSGVFIA